MSHTASGAPITNAATTYALSLGDGAISGAVPPTALLRPSNLTVEAWVQLDETASGQMVIFQQGAPGAGYALQVGADGKLQFLVGGGP